ncbi:SasC/FmtB family protein [Staphylococcus haemolyticus]|uniref:SasC/FmtB family protein n=1 Tax=Staphylococcus haemolyticus TaxID=1283 RepID=UPI001F2B783E|nr:SasC/FmtB family protein [Staphylococcus haemolyticus]MCE4992000.1 DUF1542 domain-containing protein [Staphylococcus haemolyticus]
MNLFKKQKFSIRKFTVGTFSTVIATLAFITHTGHAAELDEHSQSAQQKITESKNTEDLNQHQSDAIKDSSKSESKINANPTLNKEAVSETTEVPNKTQTTNSTENKNSTEISDKDIDKSKVKGNNVDTNQPILDNNESNKNSKSAPTHKRVKRDANDATSNTQTQQDPMAINETNSGQIINGNFTDTSNGAEIPTAATESAMDEASKIPGWKVVNSQQTQIPLVWGPKVLPSYTYITFDKTNNKIGAVLSKYSYNLSYGRPDNSVGPIYQDIDVTPGSELQFHYLGSSIGNISGFNSARMFIYDANNPSTLLYKGTPKTSSQPFGIFKGVFNVPENISRIRLQFESLVNVSHDTYNGHRLLKGPNNFGGGVVVDVSVNTGAYLKVSAAQTEYQANSTSNSSPDVNAKLNVSIENKGHSSSNKTQYKVVLPEGVTFVSAENATGTFNEDTRELTLNINPINAGTTRDISYTVSLPTTVPIKKDFNANLIYQTEGINMNRQNGSRDLAVQTPGDNNYLRYGGNNEFIITESDQRQGSTIAPTQSVTVNMYKDAINSKISEIETELAQVNQNDYSTEAWNNLQTALTNAKVVKNETDATPLTDRKNQAEINKLLLNLEKAKAKFDIDKAAKARESVINSNTEATTEEKQAALTKLQNKFNENKAEIDKLTISNDIAPLKESSISQINSINVTATKKAEAKQAIEAALTQRKVFIDGHYDATQEEKDVALAKIDEAAKQAKAAIDAATTNNAVDEAITNNTTIISGILPEMVKKAAARKAIDDAATAKKEAINNTPDATQEEKDEAIVKVDAAVSAAKQAITQATTNDSVDQEQTNGNNTIASIQPEVTKKAAARKAIDDEVVAKKAAIDTVADATDEEKQAAKDKVDAEATKAKAAIDRANTNSDVEQAKSSSVSTIEAIQPETIKKSSAKRAIDDSANAKKAAIDNNSDATQEEKDAAKAKVDAEVTKAKAAIDQATTNDGVDQAKDLGNNAISIIQPDVVKKVAARKAIDDAATAKKQEIDQHPTATQEEKEAAKAKVDAEVQKAKDAINQANSNNDVDQVQNSETATIAGIQVDAVKKATAKQTIDVALAAKKQEIDNNENATQEEKEAAKTKVDEEATKAKATIDQASTNSDVEQAKSTGEAKISSIQPEVVKKSEAKQAIDDAVTAKKAEIDQNQEATKEEKDAAKAKVDEEATKAKAAISQASTNNDVDQAKTSSVTTISSIQPEIVKKSEAKKAIEDEVIAKKAEIDQNQEATKEEKDAAKAKVDEAVRIAKENIDKSLNNNEVDESLNKGELQIKNVHTTVIAKEKALKHLMDIATKQKAKIDSNQFATDEEKSRAKHKIDQIINKAYTAIKKAKSNSEVNNIDDKYSKLISETNTIAKAKLNAKKIILNKASEAKRNIENSQNISNEEKNKLKALIDDIVKSSLQQVAKAKHDILLKQIVEETKVKLNNIKFNIVQSTEKENEIQKEESKNKKEKVNSKLEVTKFNGSTQLPNTGVNMTYNVVPLTQLSLISGLFLLLISKRRKNAK